MTRRTLVGTTLHRGQTAEVTLARADGPIRFVQRGAEATLAELTAVRTSRGVTLATRDERIVIELVEHLLAAFGGLGVREGVRIEIDGDELPLLDGGAAEFTAALREIEAPAGRPPSLTILRAAVFEDAASTYRFEPSSSVELAVHIAFGAPVGEGRASWRGGADDFAARIAPARTFAWLAEVEALRAEGRALGDVAASAVVFDASGPLTGPLAGEDEPARHKLLDLIGDLALYGGPPRGRIEASKPGHGATHAIVRKAFETGVLRTDLAVGIR